MHVAWFSLIALLASCKEDHSSARQVSAGSPTASKQAPEPPGGPPTCADVGAHLADKLELSGGMTGELRGAKIEVSADTMRAGMVSGIADACRSMAWSLDARKCAMQWEGNFVEERTKLRDACPGTVK